MLRGALKFIKAIPAKVRFSVQLIALSWWLLKRAIAVRALFRRVKGGK